MTKALFLDRDGVINVERDFVFRREEFEFREGIFEVVRIAHDACLKVIVVTNQSGIARGYYSQADFWVLTDWMCSVFEAKGTPIARVYHCPFHPDYPMDEFAKYATWRKPEAGMFLQAAADFEIDLVGSFMIGDRVSDAVAATKAGLDNIMLLGDEEQFSVAPGISVEYSPHLRGAAVWLQEKIAYA